MSNILEVLREGATVHSYSRIKLPIEGKADIYGFVPYQDSFDSCFGTEETLVCPPLGPANVVGNRIIFPIGDKFFRAPVFNSVSLSEDKYPVYLLYIPYLLNHPSNNNKIAYKKAFLNEKPKLTGYQKYPAQIREIDGILFYLTQKGEYIFSSNSKLRGIGNSFVVITRRLSKENGTVLYEVYNPEEVEIISLYE